MGLLYNEHGNSRNRHIAFRPCCRVSATGHLSFGADADRRFRDSIHRLVPDELVAHLRGPIRRLQHLERDLAKTQMGADGNRDLFNLLGLGSCVQSRDSGRKQRSETMRDAVSKGAATDVQSVFKKHFGFTPPHVVQAPGRLELLSNHTDYNQGLGIAVAVNKYLAIASSPRTHAKNQLVAVAIPAKR